MLAHRCGSAEGFESSVNAALTAIDNGAHSVDIDLVLTKDGVPLVYHDLNLKRLNGLNETIANLNYDELPPYLPSYNVSFYPE